MSKRESKKSRRHQNLEILLEKNLLENFSVSSSFSTNATCMSLVTYFFIDDPLDSIIERHFTDTMPYPASWVYTDDSEFSSNPFFGQDPIKTMQEDGAAKVPIIIGFTKEDGLLPSATFKKHPQLFDYFK